MNIYIIHDAKRRSPYFEALINTLQANAVNVFVSSDLPPKRKVIERSIIHFHRLGRYLDKKKKNEIIQTIIEYKQSGYEFAWTIHNFIPLEMSDSSEILEFTGFIKAFAIHMDYILTHTEIMRKNAISLFNQHNIYYIGFGIDYALNDDNKISSLSLTREERFTFLHIGNMRDYKGIEELIHSFRYLVDRGYDIRLILAGPQYKNYIKNNIDISHPNIVYIDKYIYESEYNELLDISDAMVFPYRVHMEKFKFGFFSAAIPEAAKHKKFLVVPYDENIEEILQDLTFCQTYDFAENSLAMAMEHVIHMPKEEIDSKANSLYRLVSENTWNRMVESMLHIFSQSFLAPNKRDTN